MSLVRAIVPDGDGGQANNVSPELAASSGWVVLDEPTHAGDGSPRPPERANGRPVKPKTSVAEAAGKKAGSSAANNSPSKEN